jgi:hypothetical protein
VQEGPTPHSKLFLTEVFDVKCPPLVKLSKKGVEGGDNICPIFSLFVTALQLCVSSVISIIGFYMRECFFSKVRKNQRSEKS